MRERLTDEQVSKLSTELPGWSVQGGLAAQGAKLQKTFQFATYAEGLSFVQAVGLLADELDHHPDMLIGYRRVTVTTSTHDADGLTGLDVQLVRRIESL